MSKEDEPITLQDMLLLPKDEDWVPPERAMPQQMSPEQHADFLKWLRWAGASEEIVQALSEEGRVLQNAQTGAEVAAYQAGREEAWNELRRAAIAHGGVSNTETGETISFEKLNLSHVGSELHAKWVAEEAEAYRALTPEQQWAADKRLGLLDVPNRQASLVDLPPPEQTKALLGRLSAVKTTYEHGYRKGQTAGVTVCMTAIAELAGQYDTPDNQWPIEPKKFVLELQALHARLGVLL